MDLSQQIEDYYKQNFRQLDPDKQFHFASRLGTWKNDEFSLNFLKQRVDITHSGNMDIIKDDLRRLLTNPPAAKVNAASSRQPYFDKYPQLRGAMLALFRVRHLLAIYNIDARHAFLELYPLQDVLKLSEELQKDTPALKVLSTYAVNYIYLVHTILFSDISPPSPIAEICHKIGSSSYDIHDPEQLQLLIYLYTHSP